LGGQDKGADWNNLFQELQKIDVKLFLIGSSIKKAVKCAENYGIDFRISENLEQAVKDINLEYSANSIAGLSPASASFDQFKSYEERGKVFKLLISSIN
jgi:UDP-N-acetylmuramoylalanine--D-glutamate ligase